MKSRRVILLVASTILLASCESSSEASDTYSMPSFFPSSSGSTSSSTSSSEIYGSDIQTFSGALDAFDHDSLGFAIETPLIQAKLERNGILDSKSLHTYSFAKEELLAKDIKDSEKMETYLNIEEAQIYKQALIGKNETVAIKVPTFSENQTLSAYTNSDGVYFDLTKAPYIYDQMAAGDDMFPKKGFEETPEGSESTFEAISLLPIMVSSSSETISKQLAKIQNDEDSNVQISFENRDGDFYLDVLLNDAAGIKEILNKTVEDVFSILGKDSFTIDTGIEDFGELKLEKQAVLEWIETSTTDITINSFELGFGYETDDIKYIDLNIDVDYGQGEDLKEAFSLDYSISKFVADFRVNILGDDEVDFPKLVPSSYTKLS